MGIRYDGSVQFPVYTPLSKQVGSFPGGVRGTAEAGHVRASEGASIDLGRILIDPVGKPKVKITNVKVIDRRDIGISVGTGVPRNRPEIIQVPSVPQVRQPIRVGQVRQPTKIVGGTETQNPFIIPRIPAGLPKLNPKILNPPDLTPAKKTGVLDVLIDLIRTNPITKVQPVALDLGNLLNTGINAYRDIRVANQPRLVDYDIQGLNPWSNVPLDQSGLVGPAPIAAAPGTCLAPGFKYDKCGNVVKTRRRRRKRLATSSDIKDLAALSSVTTGPEKKTWIATHPS